MKTCHQIIEQYKRLESENYKRLKDARWKSMNTKDEKTAAKYEQLRQSYAVRSESLYNRFMSTLRKHGEECRAKGMTWSWLANEYV